MSDMNEISSSSSLSESSIDMVGNVICPITLSRPDIDVLSSEGIHYNFVDIAQHCLSNGLVGPLGRETITSLTLDFNAPHHVPQDVFPEKLYLQLLNKYPQLILTAFMKSSTFQSMKAFQDFRQELEPECFSGNDGITLFHFAADRGRLLLMKALKTALGDEIINQGYKDNITPLHMACMSGQIEVVKWLLSLGHVNVNAARSSNGETALHVAANAGQKDIVDLLVKHKDIDINAERNNLTALEHAVYRGYATTVASLLNHPQIELRSSVIRLAREKKNSAVLSVILDWCVEQLLCDPTRLQQMFDQHQDVLTYLQDSSHQLQQKLKTPSASLQTAVAKRLGRDEQAFHLINYYQHLQDILTSIPKMACLPLIILVFSKSPGAPQKASNLNKSSIFSSSTSPKLVELLNFCNEKIKSLDKSSSKNSCSSSQTQKRSKF